MGNKEEKLEATMLLESCDQAAVTGTYGDKSCNWSTAVHSYSCSEGAGKEGGCGVIIVYSKWIECEELSLKKSHK